MSTASPIVRRFLVPNLVLGLGLALSACGGESKPAAKAPAESKDEASPQAAKGEGNMGEIAKDGVDAANAGGEKVKVVDGAAPGDERYALQIEPPADAAAGKEGEVMVRVVPKEPWHMNLDYPTSLKVQPPSGVAVTKADLKKADARKLDDSSCEFAVGFTPSEAGEHEFTGTFKFAVCQDEACSPVTEDVTFKVAVK